MKAKYGLICALSLNIVLASALNAKSAEDIAADRANIQKIYNIYNNELVAENNSLMIALNNFGENTSTCLIDFYGNETKASSLKNAISNFEKDLQAFELSYKDIKDTYNRQLKQLELLDKTKGVDIARLDYARNLLKNLNLIDPNELRQVKALESNLNNIENMYTSDNQSLATISVTFSLVKPQIDGIETSLKSLTTFFDVAKTNLEKSQTSLAGFEPELDTICKQYKAYLDVSVKHYDEMGILSEDILAKTLESFYDIKESFDSSKASEYHFKSYKNLTLRGITKPNEILRTDTTYLGAKAKAADKKVAFSNTTRMEMSKSDNFAGGNSNRMLSKSYQNDEAKTIKVLIEVNAIIDDLTDNWSTRNRILMNISNLSKTIDTMNNKSITLLKKSLTLSTDSQVLLTNIEIFKGELDIKSRQANISVENIKKSLDEIESSRNKIKELF